MGDTLMQVNEITIKERARKMAEEMKIIPIGTRVICTGTFRCMKKKTCIGEIVEGPRRDGRYIVQKLYCSNEAEISPVAMFPKLHFTELEVGVEVYRTPVDWENAVKGSITRIGDDETLDIEFKIATSIGQLETQVVKNISFWREKRQYFRYQGYKDMKENDRVCFIYNTRDDDESASRVFSNNSNQQDTWNPLKVPAMQCVNVTKTYEVTSGQYPDVYKLNVLHPELFTHGYDQNFTCKRGQIIDVVTLEAMIIFGQMQQATFLLTDLTEKAQENVDKSHATLFRLQENRFVAVADDDLCSVCMHNQKEVVLQPCGHRCVCQQCYDRIMNGNKKCPVCRGIISTFVRSYGSMMQENGTLKKYLVKL